MSSFHKPTVSKLKVVIQSGRPQDEPNNPKFMSKLGTIVYSGLTFNKYKPDKVEEGEYTWEDLRIDDALILVSQSKKIIDTEIQGKDGTVKEYIGMDNYQIQITGRLTAPYNVNPKEETRHLNKILSANQSLDITSWYLQNLDITQIVVTSYDLPQTEGEYSTQYFTINAISDKPAEARIYNIK